MGSFPETLIDRKFSNHHPKSGFGRLREVPSFDWENVGDLGEWSLTRGSSALTRQDGRGKKTANLV